jgi:hypothetical protein
VIWLALCIYVGWAWLEEHVDETAYGRRVLTSQP